MLSDIFLNPGKKIAVLMCAFLLVIVFSYLEMNALRKVSQEADHLIRAEKAAGELDNVIFGRLQQAVFTISRSSFSLEALESGLETPVLLDKLETIRMVTNASIVYLMNRSGTVIASTRYLENHEIKTLTGNKYEFRPYFIEAMKGNFVIFPALGVTTLMRGVYFSAPVVPLEGEQPAGVAVIKMGPEELDSVLSRGDRQSVLITPSGVVFSSSNSDWLYKFVPPISDEEIRRIRETRQFEGHSISMVPFNRLKRSALINGINCIISTAVVGTSQWQLVSLERLRKDYPLNHQQKEFLIWSILTLLLFTATAMTLLLYGRKVRKAEARSVKSEEKYRMMFAAEKDGIMLFDAENMSLLEANHVITDLYHYAQEELIGKKFSELASPSELTGVFSEPGIEPETERLFSFRYHRRKDGTFFPVEVGYHYFIFQKRRLICARVRDATAKNEAIQALRSSEMKFRTLYENASDAIMLLEENRFFDCNRATLELFGCNSADDFLNRLPSEFSPALQPDGQDSSTAAAEHIRLASLSGNHRFEWMHCKKDGTPFPAEVWLTSIKLGDKSVIQAVVRDISGLKKEQ
ncbi:MAG: PAS domain S-box protein, partial [Candidatus Wallbacteria bacterium]|nr:PAS domain S-box protein [Candidatus Wallbacteria bacterium]